MDGKALGDMPAMPVQGNCVDASGAYCGDVVYAKGLTLRQHYAGLAMQGRLASGSAPSNASLDAYNHWLKYEAIKAVNSADALLAALTEEAK